ncbi:hypothetical protein PMI07_002061 [Rhizobium sp. CF080]|uniref:hypothetical protein n=1 Tax=Rhizobium sp. (strain CF080) TaxID=1144310 RepID=UPI000271CE07|nr:hypothetical protein [Rhizobium sp. CF080]EUB95573.1 hypothetical protein PMI07_002061 [Rhizobium sp. CF080]
MNFRFLLALPLCVMVAGCQNAGYIMDTYNKVGKQTVVTPGGNFWVFDRPDLGKILTTPTPGTIAGPAVFSGMTLGLVKLDPIVQAHQAVAQMWFAKTGRICEIKTSSEIWRPEYEHLYVCK